MFHWIKLVDKSVSKLIIDESAKNLCTKKYANLQNFTKLFDCNFHKTLFIVYGWFDLILI